MTKKTKSPRILRPAPRLMLAYGSNLNKAEMRFRARDARPRGTIILDNARLVFRGVADVECVLDSQAPCGLWEISRADEVALDRYEGVAGGFYVKDEVPLGRGEVALIYTMTATGVFPPPEGYVARVRQGYRDFGLDEAYLDAAIIHAFKRKDPCEQTIARRARQRKSDKFRRLVQMPEALAMKKVDRLRAIEDGAAYGDTTELMGN